MNIRLLRRPRSHRTYGVYMFRQGRTKYSQPVECYIFFEFGFLCALKQLYRFLLPTRHDAH